MTTFLKTPSDEGVIRTTANTLLPNPQVGRSVLLAAILGSSMAFLDDSVVNVALPLLQADLHATAAEVQWVMELYLLFLAAFLLVGGILGDHSLPFSGTNLLTFLLYAAFGGITFLLPFNLIQVQGWLMIGDMPSRRASRAVTGESAEDNRELSVNAASGGLPGSHA